jgi:5-methyltetrahydrofolate--homocysteine methyltransferase
MATVKGDVHDIGKNIVGVVLGCNSYSVIDLGVMVSCDRILDTAMTEGADMIGLSGLITPSLDEMVHVAKEMERRKMSLPLLIGGATTSRQHTAVKIAPEYSHPVLHVLDASRAVGAVASLLDPKNRVVTDKKNREEQAMLRTLHANREKKPLLPLATANERRPKLSFGAADVAKPESFGPHVVEGDLAEIARYIDWTFFFTAWELKAANSPRSSTHPQHGECRARPLRGRAEAPSKDHRREAPHGARRLRLLARRARATTSCLRSDDAGQEVCALPACCGSRAAKDGASRSFAPSPISWPRGSRCPEGLRGRVCRDRGHRRARRSRRSTRPSTTTTARSCEGAGGSPRRGVRRVAAPRGAPRVGLRQDAEDLSNEDLVAEKYRGIRPAFGYPACPDHTEKRALFSLLGAEQLGLALTESFAMTPAASVSGLYFAHPDARYFMVGRIGRDQVEDYARRKGISAADAERALAPNLGYESSGC